MNTILTDDERPNLPEQKRLGSELTRRGIYGYTAEQMKSHADAREAAVLAKLAQQEPVAYVPEVQLKLLKKHGNQAVVLHDKPAACGLDAALYTHPAPQADRQRVPEGWKLVPVEPTSAMLKELGNSWDGVNRATWQRVIAAATEAPAQASACCGNWAAGTSCFADPKINCPRLLPAPEAPAQASAVDERAAITEEDAYEMGAKGAEPTERERKLFEAWMRGHCWALSAHWDGRQYVSDAEQDGDVDPRAVATRRLWAAWRDRAALAQKGGAA